MYELAKRMPVQAYVWSISNRGINIESGPGVSPLLVFVNVKSGGQTGISIRQEFISLLNPVQVIDIKREKGPKRALEMFKPIILAKKLKLLVCGGDGTVGWVVNELYNLYGKYCSVPIGILPLGTGNDLSQMFGWGNSFNGDIRQFLQKILRSHVSLLDIWLVRAVNIQGKTTFSTTFQNYLDLGISARIALKFHQLRESHPELFQSRLGNKFLYGEVGIREFIIQQNISLKTVRLWCDNKEVLLPENNIEDICVINIASFAGGLSLWKDKELFEHEYKVNFDDNDFSSKRCYSWSGNLEFQSENIDNIPQHSYDYPSTAHMSDQINFMDYSKPFYLSKKISDYKNKTNEKKASNIETESNEDLSRLCKKENSSINDENPKIIRKIDASSNTYKNARYISWQNPVTRTRWRNQSMNDQIIEVVAFRNLFHLAQVQVGLAEPLRVCQGKALKIEVCEEIPIQVDGEPQILYPCTLYISHKFQAEMLSPDSSNLLDNSVIIQQILDSALQRDVINRYQRDSLMKEFCKRLP